jgi:hypothetical protein
MSKHDHGEDFFFFFLDANDMDACKGLNMQWMRKHIKLNRVDAWIVKSKHAMESKN